MDKKTNIYYLHNGNNVPFYVGKTVQNPNKRLNNHKKVFGNNTLLEVIDIVKNNNWLFWEKHYISLFKSWGFNLKNKNEGGGGCLTHEVSELAREKISKTHKNLKKPFTENHKINHKNSYKNRNVTWGNKISKGLKGRKITWDQGNVGKPSSPINQYDLEENFIKRWDNIKEPSSIYKCYISGCLRGRQLSSGGYIWKYANK
jgi:hypothetical protein